MDMRYILSLLIFFSLAVAAAALPVLPDEFAGSVTLDGRAAPIGTTVTARIDWNERGTTITTETGMYGPLDSPGALAVKATEDDLRYTASPTITFWVNGHKADQEIAFIGGTVRHLNLSAVTGGEEETEPVPGGSGGSSFEFEGVRVTDTGEGQQVAIDSRTVLGNITTSETAITLNNVGGWEEVVIFTKEKPRGDTQITGTVESVRARSNPVSIGTAWAQIDLEMSRHPDSTARLDTTIFEKPGADEQEAFENIAYELEGRGASVSIAYVLNVQKTGVANEGDGDGIIRAATIRMAASPGWVASMGGEANITILRRADDGTITPLDTICAGQDAAGNYIFEAISPGGLSAFALVAAKAPDSSSPGPGSSTGSGGGGSSRDPGSQIVYDPDAPETHIGSAPLSTSSTGVVLESVTVRTADGTCAVMIREGITARDGAGKPLGEVTGRKVALADVPAVPQGMTVIAALDCGPAGASFDPPAILTFTLSADEWARIDRGATAKVMWYSPETEEWQDIPATVNSDTRTVTAEVDHFSIYALAWTAAEATATPVSVDTTPAPDQEPGAAFPVWMLAVVVVLIVAGAAFLVMRKK